MNSNLYGHLDRRKKTPAASIHVQDSIDAVYAETAYKLGTDWGDIDRVRIESDAYRSAHSWLTPKERHYIDADIKRLKEACAGTNFGDGSAMQVLAKLGIFLRRAEEEGER